MKRQEKFAPLLWWEYHADRTGDRDMTLAVREGAESDSIIELRVFDLALEEYVLEEGLQAGQERLDRVSLRQ
jgi:hypothetical protein